MVPANSQQENRELDPTARELTSAWGCVSRKRTLPPRVQEGARTSRHRSSPCGPQGGAQPSPLDSHPWKTVEVNGSSSRLLRAICFSSRRKQARTSFHPPDWLRTPALGSPSADEDSPAQRGEVRHARSCGEAGLQLERAIHLTPRVLPPALLNSHPSTLPRGSAEDRGSHIQGQLKA